MVVICVLVCSRLGRVPTGKHETRGEFYTLVIFLACIPGFLFFVGL